MDLLLVRHAESEGNARGLIQGWRDYPLTERGVAQARALANVLSRLKLDWTSARASPSSRAAETARILAESLSLPEPRIDPSLREHSAGRAEGRARVELEAEYGRERVAGWLRQAEFSDVGGESSSAVQRRVEAVIDALEEHHRQDGLVLLVSHGGLLKQLLKLLCSSPTPAEGRVRFGNCTSALVRERRDGRRELAWHLPLEVGLALGGCALPAPESR